MLTLDQIDDLAEAPLPLPGETQGAIRVLADEPETQPQDLALETMLWPLFGWLPQPR